MSINASNTLNQMQNDTNRVNYMNSRKNLGSSRLDRESFIRLIMAQLQYQDPTNPSDSSQMLQQQLALEQADQMSNLVSANKFAQAGSMVGQEVEMADSRWDFTTNATGPAELTYDSQLGVFVPKSVTGTVESVMFDRIRNKALIKVNGNYYDADIVRQVNQQQTSSTPPATGGS